MQNTGIDYVVVVNTNQGQNYNTVYILCMVILLEYIDVLQMMNF